jgi:hypothetical protein
MDFNEGMKKKKRKKEEDELREGKWGIKITNLQNLE